jgi:aromatic-L-amino-acid/L-tryptophan decarboxylase
MSSAGPELFPPGHERVRVDDDLTRKLARVDGRVATGSATPTLDMDAFQRELAEFDFRTSRPLTELIDWSVRMLESGVVHPTHPRYFGLYNPKPNFPSQCADRIAGAFNPQLASATTSPAAVALESHVIRSIARRAGLPDGAGGHFTSGGSEANLTALLCALTQRQPEYARMGARAFSGVPVFYASKESHRSWEKIGHQSGIGREAVRLVSTDGRGRMSAAALGRLIEADLAAGRVPVMIAATAGTTSAGEIDPLGECAELACRHALWLHVDAAWGGAVIVSDRLRPVLAGIERADSATIDAHKWLATTMGCGMFLIRERDILPRVFHADATYMPSRETSVDPYVNSIQWSRRFLGLRLFLSLAVAGWQGYAAHIERAVAHAAQIRRGLIARRWSVLNDSPLAVLAVTPPPGHGTPREIVHRILESGIAWVSVARFEEQDVIRICVTHGETSDEDVALLVDALHRSGGAAASVA